MITAKPWKMLSFLFALLFLAGTLHGICLADDEEGGDDKNVELKEGMDYPSPAPGTDQFLATGHIDYLDLEKEVIAVDDAHYNLLPDTAYYTSVLGAGSIHLLREGAAVGFVANRKGQIFSIWLIE